MSPPNTPSLQLLSLNVNGLRGKQKRAALFATLQSGPWQVIALQETQISGVCRSCHLLAVLSLLCIVWITIFPVEIAARRRVRLPSGVSFCCGKFYVSLVDLAKPRRQRRLETLQLHNSSFWEFNLHLQGTAARQQTQYWRRHRC